MSTRFNSFRVVLLLAPYFLLPCNAQAANRLTVHQGDLILHIGSGANALSDEEIRAWINTAADAVSGYFGRFPVDRVDIYVRFSGRGGHVNGRTFSGRRINMDLGAGTMNADLQDDWVLTHEMFHLGFPDLPEEFLWMNEGLSTYLEPIARARLGTLTAEKVWRDIVEGMPQGLPEADDRGLNRTHTWGRTYWGGAMFWLLADMKIREQTHNQRSLDDAIRAIRAAGGTGAQMWSVQQVINVGGAATGTHVLDQLYNDLALAPGRTDLAALWKSLGIRVGRDGIHFDDSVPLASARRAITARTNEPISRP